MRVIALKPLREFWQQHPDAEQPLKAWYAEVQDADWTSAADVKQQYGSASIVGRDRVVFNIRGNNYRLIARIVFQCRLVYVRFIGTHKEYDKVDATRA